MRGPSLFFCFISKSEKCIPKNVHTIFLDKMYFYAQFMPYFMPLKFCWYLHKQKSSGTSKIWSIGQMWPRWQNTDLNISITRGQRGTKFWFWGPLIYTYLCIKFQLNRRWSLPTIIFLVDLAWNDPNLRI